MAMSCQPEAMLRMAANRLCGAGSSALVVHRKRKRPATQRMQPGERGHVVEASEAAPSRIDEWRRFFRERGIAPHDVPLALAVHEVHAPPCAVSTLAPFHARTLSGVPSAGGHGWGDDPVRY